MSINSVTIGGNLTKDPVYKATSSGTALLELSVAVNERVRGEDGKWYDRANYIDCTIWGKRADALSKILSKGMKVVVHGALRQSSWNDKETGKYRSKVTVNVSEVELMQTKGSKPAQAQQPDPADAQPADLYSDEDVPF